eukprot:2201724-Rhodomonas_salina.1
MLPAPAGRPITCTAESRASDLVQRRSQRAVLEMIALTVTGLLMTSACNVCNGEEPTAARECESGATAWGVGTW